MVEAEKSLSVGGKQTEAWTFSRELIAIPEDSVEHG